MHVFLVSKFSEAKFVNCRDKGVSVCFAVSNILNIKY